MEESIEKITLALVNQKVDFLIKEVDEIKTKLDSHYVTQEAFIPVRNVVYGMVGLILTAVVTALIMLVLRQ
jgi:tetrahydromethanopterin S-methyltransferase subunit B